MQNYLTENLPQLQEAVENKLEVKLGEIQIKSIYSLADDLIKLQEEKESLKKQKASKKNEKEEKTFFQP